MKIVYLIGWATGLALLAATAGEAFAEAGPREQVLLNGSWRGALAPRAVALADIADWRDQSVPGIFRVTVQDAPRSAWVRRDVAIPERWAGRRIFLRLGGALFHPHVYLDGRRVGDQFDGWSPFELELTDHVTPGRTHELAVLCHDQTIVYDADVPLGDDFTEAGRRGKVLALVGGYKDHIGVWDDVVVFTSPASRIIERELVIDTSTREQRITLRGRIDGEPRRNVSIEAVVLDGDEPVLRLAPARVEADGSWRLREPFPDAKNWSPEHPHLYTLRLRLTRGGEVVDQVDQRFGFREFWIDGANFYLNGVRRHLLGDSHWPPARPVTEAFIRHELETFRAAGCNVFRTHIGGWQRRWYEVADEVGIMMIPEAPAYTDGEGFYAYQNPVFWDHYRDHVARMIRTYRNHPSVVMYSLGNEIIFMGNLRHDPQLNRKLGDLARFARTIDPRFAYTMEGDLDPDGAFDVIGLHYPHELPDNFAYPNTGDWLAQRKRTEAGGGMLGEQRSDFYWDRDKPLYIGEYLWCPFEDYSPGTVYFGEEAYRHHARYATAARYAAQFDQTVAYRRADVSGLCPWATADDEQPYFRHVAAYLWTHATRGYAGEPFTFEYDVFNDSPRSLTLTLAITERSGTVAPQQVTLTLEPAAYQRVALTVDTPDAPTTLALRTELTGEGQTFHAYDHPLTLAARRQLTTRHVVYDPHGIWPHAVDSLAGLHPDTVLLIAPGALGGAGSRGAPAIGRSSFDTAAFLRFVTAGGRVVVLEQATLRPLGLAATLVEHAATMTFPVDPTHPILAGLDASALRHWRDDHDVTRHAIVRPTTGGARTVAVSGGPKSLDQGPIIEMPVGRGHVVLIQALVGEKLDREPAARQLLHNTLEYLANLEPHETATLVLSDDASFLERLDALGVAYRQAAEALRPGDLDTVGLVVLHGGGLRIADSRAALAQFPGRVYWHQPDPDTFASLREALGCAGLVVTEAESTPTILDRDAVLLRGISREDLIHTTASRGWRRSIALVPAAARAILPQAMPDETIDRLTPDRMQASPLAYGATTSINGAGALTGELSARTSGLHRLTVRLSVTPESEALPYVRVRIDDELATVIYPQSAAGATDYTVLVSMPEGASAVELFPEPATPRGPGGAVTVESVALHAPVTYPPDVTVLALPGSLVAVEGRVVLDGMHWPGDGPNAARWGRYASALLANLGAAFVPPQPGPVSQNLPLTAFALIGESPYYEADAARIILRSNGRIEATFHCAAAGRYGVTLRGHSSAVEGEYGRVRVTMDGAPFGEVECAASATGEFDAGTVPLDAGLHTLGIEFFNDATRGEQDRNLTLEGVHFTPR